MKKISFLAAPALMFGYGVVRIIDGLDGSHGPGPAWTIGHLMFIAALLLFPIVLIGLRSLGQPDSGRPSRAVGTAAVVVGIVGLIAFIRTFVIDILAGIGSADRADMDVQYLRFDAVPFGLSANDVLNVAGPVLFGIGLLALLIRLTLVRPRQLSWWSPVLGLVTFVFMTADLDLLPLGAITLAVALLPAFRNQGPPRGQISAASTSSST